MELKKKRKQFSRHFITQVLAEVESGFSRIETCEKYGIGYNTLGEWIVRYGSKEYLETTKQWFTDVKDVCFKNGTCKSKLSPPVFNTSLGQRFTVLL